jgi:hypothetical protein
MALNNEDKKDVQKHMGKALANKVSKVTRDKNSFEVWSKSKRNSWKHQDLHSQKMMHAMDTGSYTKRKD